MNEIIDETIWLAEIESTLILNYFPFYFAMDKVQEGDISYIQIMICCKSFSNKSINDRIKEVYKLINQTNPDILKNMRVLIETYDTVEFEGLIENGNI